ADGRLLGPGLETLLAGPAGVLGNPEDVVGGVLVAVLRVGPRLGEQLRPVFLEGVGDVLEEDEAEDDVLVLGGVHRAAELVGGEPELLLEAEGRPVVGGLLACHDAPFPAWIRTDRHARAAVVMISGTRASSSS